jgi:hypothetical protein
MHKIPLTNTEKTGLIAHGLDICTPSQLSDAFRQGVSWGEKQNKEPLNEKQILDFFGIDEKSTLKLVVLAFARAIEKAHDIE